MLQEITNKMWQRFNKLVTVTYDKCENDQNIYWITILAAPSQIQLLEMSTLLNIPTTLLFSLLSVPLSKLPYTINNHTCEVCIHLMNLKTETVTLITVQLCNCSASKYR